MSSGSLYRRIQVCNCFKFRTVKRVTIRLIRLRAVTFEYVYLYFKHRSKTVDMGRKFGKIKAETAFRRRSENRAMMDLTGYFSVTYCLSHGKVIC